MLFINIEVLCIELKIITTNNKEDWTMATDVMSNGQVVKASLMGVLDEHSFKNWFEPVVFSSDAGSSLLRLTVPNAFFQNWIKEHYLDLIMEHGRKVGIETVEFETNSSLGTAKPVCPGVTPTVAPAPRRELKPFDLFVSDLNNRLALAAVEALTSNLVKGEGGEVVFVHGPTGVGKTHLLEGAQAFVQARGPNLDTRFITAKQFTEMSVAAARAGGELPKAKTIKLLLVDDIQSLPVGKGVVQKDFAALLDQVLNSGGSVAIASMLSPDELEGRFLPEVLSRALSGIVASVFPLETATLVGLLKKLVPPGRRVDDEALELLARLVPGDLRRLKGALKTALLLANIRDAYVTVEIVQQALGTRPPRPVSLQDVLNVVAESCGYFAGLQPDFLKGKSRKRELVFARQLAIYLLSTRLGMENRELQDLTRHDHSTIIYSRDKIEGMRGDSRVVEAIAKLDKIARGLG